MLGGETHDVWELAKKHGLTVANDNAPGQLVLSGPVDGIDAAAAEAREAAGARAMKLDVAGAFHSPLMQPAAARLAAALEKTPIHDARIPVYSNGSVAPFVDVRRELAENLLKPVRWRETLLALRGAGAERFIELGPGAVLTGMVKRTLALAA
jgi:malonyl CoA-acyl carrier protein transacylase